MPVGHKSSTILQMLMSVLWNLITVLGMRPVRTPLVDLTVSAPRDFLRTPTILAPVSVSKSEGLWLISNIFVLQLEWLLILSLHHVSQVLGIVQQPYIASNKCFIKTIFT